MLGSSGGITGGYEKGTPVVTEAPVFPPEAVAGLVAEWSPAEAEAPLAAEASLEEGPLAVGIL